MSYPATLLQAAETVSAIERSHAGPPKPGDVRLRLATASLCGTDLHYYRHFQNAGFQLQRPVTLGHEGCAYVLDPNGSDFEEEQLVALNPIINCGVCEFCLAGEENLCTAKRFPGSATTVPHIDGFFQAEFDFPARCCRKAPAGTKPEHLTFAEPLACAMHAVKISAAAPGKRVLVTGCGPMGLLAIVAAQAAGADVDATDVRPEAVETARLLGIGTGFVAPQDAIPAVSYDAVIEASGSPHAFNQALEAVRRKGKVAILSTIQPSATPINLHRIMLKEIAVSGSFQFNREFDEAIALIASGKIDLDKLIAARFPLSATADALAMMASGGAAGKILLLPEASAA